MPPVTDRTTQILGWTLAMFYLLGSPVAAYLEFQDGLISQRFGLSSVLIYLVSAVQTIGAPMLLVPRFAPWVAFGLSLITIGAIGVHLSIGSPLTAIPAVIATVLQTWYGVRRLGSEARTPPSA